MTYLLPSKPVHHFIKSAIGHPSDCAPACCLQSRHPGSIHKEYSHEQRPANPCSVSQAVRWHMTNDEPTTSLVNPDRPPFLSLSTGNCPPTYPRPPISRAFPSLPILRSSLSNTPFNERLFLFLNNPCPFASPPSLACRGMVTVDSPSRPATV